MASGLFLLLDDIASILNDVAVYTKVSATKTSAVLGDDLALNAQQVSGVSPIRELPIVWAVAKGSVVNKAILIPSALLLSSVAPWAITPLMIVGGSFLCFEGNHFMACDRAQLTSGGGQFGSCTVMHFAGCSDCIAC